MARKIDKWVATDGTEWSSEDEAENRDAQVALRESVDKYIANRGGMPKGQATRAKNFILDYLWHLNDWKIEV